MKAIYMKRIVLSLLMIAFAFSAMAQTSVVSGVVLDSLSRAGEPSAVVQFFKASDMEKPVAFTTTDVDGAFSQGLSGKGEFVAMYSNVGRKTTYKHFNLDGQAQVNIGEILAQDDVEVLDAGKVTALRTLVKMDVDKMTYKVEDDVDAKTSTVLEMLRKVPMVSVDGDDNITVNGSSNFQVLVDGKPNVMISSNPSQVFKSMPASAVKDIQVITNPGVKYDAEGVGGVLNITTTRAQTGGAPMPELDGYNATLGLNGSTRFDNGYGYGLRSFITGQKGKFTYSANLNLNRNIMDGIESTSTQAQLGNAGQTISETINNMNMGSKSLMGMASIDLGYEIDKLRIVSASFGLMGLNSNSATDQLTEMMFGGVPMMSYGSAMNSKNKMNSITASVDYQRNFANNPDRSFVFSYQLSSRPMDTWSETLFDAKEGNFFDMTNRYSDGLTNTLQNTFQADYSDKWGKVVFNTGAKFIGRMNKADQDQYFWQNDAWKLNDMASENYRNANNIAAAYAQFSYAPGKFSYKAGARYEHTFQSIYYLDDKGNSLKVNYGDLVPTASVQYNISMTQNIGLSYNMRIRRPGISFLDPFVDVSDPTMKMYGNPDLKTERAHTLNLVYNYFAQGFMLNVTLRETYSGNGISSYNFYDADGILNMTYGNILKSNTLGMNVYANWNIGSKTRIMLNGSVGYNTMDNPMQDLHNSGFNGMGLLGIQQTMFWDLRASANIIANSRRKTVDGWSSGMSMAMLSLTKTFFDDKLSASISGTLPLAKDFKMKMENHTAGPDYRMDSINIMPMGQIQGSLTWSFGNKKSVRVKRTRTSISNDDLMDNRGEDSSESGASSAGAGAGAGAGMGGGMRM